MASTATNKQPLLIDRPLIDQARVTTQIAGNAANKTLFVQGGQQPALLVDMDATLTDDINNGGVIDSIHIVREQFSAPADYVLNATTSGQIVSLTSGTVVHVTTTGSFDSGSAPSGIGYYTYTGAISPFVEDISDIDFTVATTTGFTFQNNASQDTVPATFVFYHTRGTTNPIPGDGDYRVIFATTLSGNTAYCDCTTEMPQLSTPVPAVGNASGIGPGEPVRNRGIYLEKGDRLYVGLFPANTLSGGTTAQGGFVVTAQGGHY